MTTTADRRFRRSLGMCVDHPFREACPGSSYCGTCLEQRAEMQAKRKAMWKAQGLCTRCGHARDNAGLQCSKCQAYGRTCWGRRKMKEFVKCA